MFTTTLAALGGTILVTVVFYAITVLVLRSAGKRSLSQTYAVDFTVAVALGSVMASVMMIRDKSLWTAAAAIATLAALQSLVTWLTTRSAAFRRVVTAEARLVLYQGRMLPGAMADESLAADVLEQAARRGGYTDTSRVHAIVLETDGSLSVIGDSNGSPGPGFVQLLDRARRTDAGLIPPSSGKGDPT